MKKNERDFNLLPNYCKKIAIALFVLSIALLFTLKAFGVGKDMSFSFSGDLCLLSLLIFVLSKEKTEDELFQRMRLHAMSAAFIVGVVFFLVISVFKFFFTVGIPMSARYILFQMFVLYFVFYYLAKKHR